MFFPQVGPASQLDAHVQASGFGGALLKGTLRNLSYCAFSTLLKGGVSMSLLLGKRDTLYELPKILPLQIVRIWEI